MTLAMLNFATPATIRDWSRVVSLADAAACLDVSADTLLRRCREQLAPAGLAYFERPAGGGKPQWFISKGYDSRLLSETWARRYVDSDLAGCSLKQQRDAMTRRECVLVFRAIRGTTDASVDVSDKAIAACRVKFPGFNVSRTSLYKWQQAYRYPCDLIALVDRRGGARVMQGSDEAWAEFRSMFLTDHRPSIRQCWKAVKRVATDNGWPWCSYTACAYQLDDRIPPQEQTRLREPAKYRTRLAPFIAQAPDSWRAGELWIGDHKQLDLVCRWNNAQIRPWLTAWMDQRTRKITGYTLSDSPNSSTILAAMRRGLLDPTNHGGPSHVWIDNGKDYDSWIFHGQTKRERQARIACKVDEPMAGGILTGLGIEAHFAEPYNPNGKARLERWFGTLTAFARTFATYTGIDPASRPEGHAELLKAGRLVPTFDEVYQRIGQFIAGANEDADHAIADLADADTGERLAPAEAFRRWSDTRRVFADPSALDLLLQQWHRPLPVGRNGVSVPIRGRVYTYGQFAQELKRFKAVRNADRTRVRVSYDPDALESIKVYTLDWQYVATVPMNKLGGMHGSELAMQHVAELNRQRKAYAKAERVVAARGIAGVLTNEEQLALVAGEQRQRAVAAAQPATSLAIVRTPLDGQSTSVQMGELRQAAGSESQPFGRFPLTRPNSLMQHVAARPAPDDDDAADVRPAMDPARDPAEEACPTMNRSSAGPQPTPPPPSRNARGTRSTR